MCSTSRTRDHAAPSQARIGTEWLLIKGCGPRMAQEHESLFYVILLPGGDADDIMTRTGGGLGLLARRMEDGWTRSRGWRWVPCTLCLGSIPAWIRDEGRRHWQRARPRPGMAQRQWDVNCVVPLSCWGFKASPDPMSHLGHQIQAVYAGNDRFDVGMAS